MNTKGHAPTLVAVHRGNRNAVKSGANYFFGLADQNEKLGNARTRRGLEERTAPLQDGDAPIMRRYLAMAAS